MTIDSIRGNLTKMIFWMSQKLPSGNLLHSYAKSQLLMGKLTISMAMFNSYATNYQRITLQKSPCSYGFPYGYPYPSWVMPPGWGLQLLDIALPKAFDQSIVQTQARCGTTGDSRSTNVTVVRYQYDVYDFVMMIYEYEYDIDIW